MYIHFAVLLVCAVGALARLGGWSEADPKALEVLQAVEFAIHNKFPDFTLRDLTSTMLKVVEAKKQVFTNFILCSLSW